MPRSRGDRYAIDVFSTDLDATSLERLRRSQSSAACLIAAILKWAGNSLGLTFAGVVVAPVSAGSVWFGSAYPAQ